MKCQKLHQKLKVKPLSVLIFIFTEISDLEKSNFLIKSLMKSEANNMGPVVQSIVSLTSSLRGQLLKDFMTL